jgi:hypothetical protein
MFMPCIGMTGGGGMDLNKGRTDPTILEKAYNIL